jgi:uncharacterized RDD family membrane protein YckC
MTDQFGASPPSRSGIAKFVTLGSGDWLELATPMTRLAARAIDFVVFSIAGWVVFVSLFFSIFSDQLDVVIDPDFNPESIQRVDLDNQIAEAIVGVAFAVAVAILVGGIVYEVTFTALKGQTPGKMATRIRVIRVVDGSVPGWGPALGRWAVPAVPVLIPVLGLMWAGLVYLSVTWDPRLRGWHDKAAGTAVVRYHRERNPMA